MNHLSNFIALFNVSPFRCPISFKANQRLLAVLDVLHSEGFLSYSFNPYDSSVSILSSSISSIVGFSKPSRRVFVYPHSIPVHSGFGVFFILSPIGIITDRVAKNLGLGGELLFFVS